MISSQQKHLRPLKTNIPPENWSLENEMSFYNAPFSGDMLIS